jgi:hypothetical protein
MCQACEEGAARWRPFGGCSGRQSLVHRRRESQVRREWPNPRLQRTRSASPPSPLSRQPLGTRRGITARIAVGALALVTLSGCYRTSNFRGGTMTDTGTFSHPRYHARLQAIPLDRTAQYQFPVSGLPSEKMTMLLHVEGGNESLRKSLESVSTQVTVSLVTAEGKPVCSAQGPLGPSWTLMSSVFEAAFWQRGCTGVQIQGGAHYVLNIGVATPDAHSAQLRLVPVLEGGGIELP